MQPSGCGLRVDWFCLKVVRNKSALPPVEFVWCSVPSIKMAKARRQPICNRRHILGFLPEYISRVVPEEVWRVLPRAAQSCLGCKNRLEQQDALNQYNTYCLLHKLYCITSILRQKFHRCTYIVSYLGYKKTFETLALDHMLNIIFFPHSITRGGWEVRDVWSKKKFWLKEGGLSQKFPVTLVWGSFAIFFTIPLFWKEIYFL